MDSAILIQVLVIGYMLLTVYMANQEQQQKQQQEAGTEPETPVNLRWMLYGATILIGTLALFVLMAGLASTQAASMSPAEQEEFGLTGTPDIGLPSLLFGLAFVLTAAYATYGFIHQSRLRVWIAERLGNHGSYDPQSVVHTTALVFVTLLLAIALGSFVTAGGTEGVAEQLEQGISPTEPVVQAVVQVVASVLGVGYLIRRSLPEALARLGLRTPTNDDLAYGFGGAVVLFIGVQVFAGILLIFFSPEQIDAQTEAAENLNAAFASIPLALLLATSAAIGEEIFFRGAIQPVFGLIPTSIFFTLMHSQVLFTPGMVWIFLVGLFLGWLRQRHSTTAAIITHFLYNFVILFFATLAQNAGGV